MRPVGAQTVSVSQVRLVEETLHASRAAYAIISRPSVNHPPGCCSQSPCATEPEDVASKEVRCGVSV